MTCSVLTDSLQYSVVYSFSTSRNIVKCLRLLRGGLQSDSRTAIHKHIPPTTHIRTQY